MFPDPKSDLSSEGKCAGVGGVGDGERGGGGDIGVRGAGKPEPNCLLEKTGLIWITYIYMCTFKIGVRENLNPNKI